MRKRSWKKKGIAEKESRRIEEEERLRWKKKRRKSNFEPLNHNFGLHPERKGER